MLNVNINTESKTFAAYFRMVVGAVVLLVIGAVVWTQVVRAAEPNIVLGHGAVAASVPATYQPSNRSPVPVGTSGACPRFTGTINDTNLGATPISSSITASNLEAGEHVTFAMTLQNTSIDQAAYDVMVNHDIPVGFELPGTGGELANLCAYNGAGTAIPYVSYGDGFFGGTDDDYIELDDGAGGALSPSDPSSGTNIVIITFDLQVAATFTPGSTVETQGQVLGYSDQDGGELFAGGTASSMVLLRSFDRAKTIIATSQPMTVSNFVVVGERVTYEVTVTVPQGQIGNVRVTDTMASGLAFVECESVVNNAPTSLSSSIAGGFSAACNDPTNPTVTNNGKDVDFTFGNITNSNRDQSVDETFTITYTAVVNNVVEASNGAALPNAARVFWTGGNTASASSSVMVHEPWVLSASSVTPASDVAIGTKVVVRTTLQHPTMSTATAYNLASTSTIPQGLEYIPGSLACTGSGVASQCTMVNRQLSVVYDELDSSGSVTIQYEALVTDALAGRTTDVATSSRWASLPNPSSVSQSEYTPTAVARSGDTSRPGGPNNAYQVSSSASLAVVAQDVPAENTPSQLPVIVADVTLPNTGMSWWGLLIGGVIVVAVCVVALRRIVRS